MRRAAVAVLIVACNGASKPQVAHVTVAPARASASIAEVSKPPAREVCPRVLESQRALVSAAIAESKKEKPGEWQEGFEAAVMKSFFDRAAVMGVACHAFVRGAWALEARSLEIFPAWQGARAELVVTLYLGDDRFVLDDTIPTGAAGAFIHVDSQLASDYDGDGVPELWVHSAEDGVEGGHAEASYLFTVHGRAIEGYAPASKLGDLGAPRDVDGDGLLDFPASLDIRLGEDIECYGKSDWAPAKLLAHARKDGTFSTNDDVAKAFVQSWCATAPTTVKNAEQALCARLWNKPRTLVTPACVPWDCARESANKPQPKNAARDCQPRIDAYDATVPFTLP